MIDLVYLWCDDADARWRAKRDAAARAFGPGCPSEACASCRYRGRDMLRHSLRSANRFLPWIGKVFIVIDDDQTPPDCIRESSAEVRLVRHSEILPQKFLPTFNSVTIEHFLHRIPDLADRFLYANDDTLFMRRLSPSFFFAEDGFPLFRFGAIRSRVADPRYHEHYVTLENAERLVRDAFGLKAGFRRAIGRLPHHNVDAYVKSDFRACHERFADAIAASVRGPFRTVDDVQRVLYADYALAVGRGHFRRATFNTNYRSAWWRWLMPAWADSLQFVPGRWRQAPIDIARFKPGLVCFNDGPDTTEADYAWLQSLLEGLES